MTYRRADNNDVFYTRISESGFRDWDAQREDFVAEGKPDRPPDVDTETLRAWLPHPGEYHLPYFQSHPMLLDGSPREVSFPVLTLSWSGAPGRLRLFVVGDDDGAFNVRVQHSDQGVMLLDVGRDYPKEMDADAVWGDIEHQIEQLGGVYPEPPRITTYTDFASFEAEMELARGDIDRGFVNPLPEGPVQ